MTKDVLYGRTGHSGWVDGSFQLTLEGDKPGKSHTDLAGQQLHLPGSVGDFVSI